MQYLYMTNDASDCCLMRLKAGGNTRFDDMKTAVEARDVEGEANSVENSFPSSSRHIPPTAED